MNKKEAKRLYDIEYRKRNKERIKRQKAKWAKNNPDKIVESRIRNKDSKKISDKKYVNNNLKKVNERKKEWVKQNKAKVKNSKYKYIQKKLSSDPLYKLKHSISCGIRLAFKRKGFTKKSRTFQILGCFYDEFKLHLEKQFEPWMNWDNYGLYNGQPEYGWDIDHIIPLKTAKTEEDVIRLNHYTNLQPLCSFYNRDVKKASIDRDEHIPAFRAWGAAQDGIEYHMTHVEGNHHGPQ